MKKLWSWLRHAATLYLIGYLILGGGVAWSLHQISFQARYRSWQLCQNSNEARVAISRAIRVNSDQIKKSSEILISASKLGPQRALSPSDKVRSGQALRYFQQQTNDAHTKALAALSELHLRGCGKKPR